MSKIRKKCFMDGPCPLSHLHKMHNVNNTWIKTKENCVLIYNKRSYTNMVFTLKNKFWLKTKVKEEENLPTPVVSYITLYIPTFIIPIMEVILNCCYMLQQMKYIKCIFSSNKIVHKISFSLCFLGFRPFNRF